jgi:hypothetical protein
VDRKQTTTEPGDEQSIAELQRRLRDLYITRYSDDDAMQQVEAAVQGFVASLLYAGSGESADFAAAIFRLCAESWQRQRALDPEAWTATDERQTAIQYRELLEAIATAEQRAAGPGIAGEKGAA